MKVHFKNVGLGDSIIIEWGNEKVKKFGIIDCNKSNDNPVLNFVKTYISDTIEFLFISHPHYDHYSGVLQLLEYCEKNRIVINYFGITFDTAIGSFYHMTYSFQKQKALSDIFDFLVYESEKKEKNLERIIQKSITLNSSLNLFDFSEFELEILKPTDLDKFKISSALASYTSATRTNKPDLNQFSSVIELRISEKSILLTSDATKKMLRSLKNYYKNKENKFFLIQVPHHGSSNNHFYNFWDELKRQDNCNAVISVGINAKYNLPHNNVVNDFHSLGYVIHSTNEINGILEVTKKGNKVIRTPTILDFCSGLRVSNKYEKKDLYNGDQTFIFG